VPPSRRRVDRQMPMQTMAPTTTAMTYDTAMIAAVCPTA
jgi:hypothetical protein